MKQVDCSSGRERERRGKGQESEKADVFPMLLRAQHGRQQGSGWSVLKVARGQVEGGGRGDADPTCTFEECWL